MGLEAKVFGELQALVAGRLYPDVAPPDARPPYMTYAQQGGDTPAFLEADAPDKRNARVQLSAWATSRAGASDLMRQAEAAAIRSPVLLAVPMGGLFAHYDPETALYGAVQFFSIWY